METYVVCIHDREVWRWRWRLWFSLFIASHESGQQQLEIQQTRANKHAYPSLIVLDGSYRWGSVDSICHGKCYVHLWVIRLVCHYTIRDRMQMSWLKYSYSMRFLFVSAIIIPSSCFFFFFPRIFSYLGNVVNPERKKSHLILPHSFPHKKCYAHCAIVHYKDHVSLSH